MLVPGGEVSGQPLGTFRWQIQPYCNVITLSVRADGAVYTLDGYDDGCGAAARASVSGTATLNPDGSIAIGLVSVMVPEAAPLMIHARIALATVSGTWSDSAGNQGAFVPAVGAGTGGPPRPMPPNGVRPGSITSTQLAPGAVDADRIAAGSIEARHFAPGTIASAVGILTSDRIEPGAITGGHIAAGAIDQRHLTVNAVGSPQIAPGAVHAEHVAPGVVRNAVGSIAADRIAPGAVGSAHIADGAVTAAHIAPGSIGAAHVAAGAITSTHVASGAVQASHLLGGAVGAAQIAPGLSQMLVVGMCPVGTYLRGLSSAGSVLCEPFVAPPVSTTIPGLGAFSGSLASLAVGSDGLPIIAHRDFAADVLLVTRCGNPACTAGTTTTIADTTPGAGYYPSVTIGAGGLPVISHMDSAAQGLRITRCGNAACTAGNVSTLADDPANPVGSRSSIAVGADGLPVIAHHDATAVALRVSKCADEACAAATESTTLDDPLVLDGYEPSIAIGTDGLPVIVHHAFFDSALRVTKCGNAACTAANISTTIADNVDPVGGSAIAVGGYGRPVISHRAAASGELRVTACGNAACSAGNVTTTVDDPANPVGEYNSLAIGWDGLPVVSHFEAVTNRLRVTKCGNATCTADNITTIVDNPAASVGFFTSLAIGADGVPIVAHAMEPNSQLRITKCGSQSCR
jgi:hypothetical protein